MRRMSLLIRRSMAGSQDIVVWGMERDKCGRDQKMSTSVNLVKGNHLFFVPMVTTSIAG